MNKNLLTLIIFILNFVFADFSFSQNAESFIVTSGLSIPVNSIQTSTYSFSSSHSTLNSTWGIYRVRINITTGNGSYGDKNYVSVILKSPDGNTLALVNTSGTLSKRNYLDTWFRDDAQMSIASMLGTTGSYYFNTPGSWIADGGSLNSKFNNGQNPNGNWTLSVSLSSSGHVAATLNSWEVEFRDSPGGDKTTSAWVSNSETGYPAYDNCATPLKMDKYRNYYGRTRLSYSCNTTTDPPYANPGPWYTTAYTNTTLDNTIWYSFMTDATGGTADILFTYLQKNAGNGYQVTVVDPGAGACVAANWSRVAGSAYWGFALSDLTGGATLGTNITYNSVIKCTGLSPNKVYYVCVDGNGNNLGTNCAGGTPTSDIEFQVEATGNIIANFSTLPIELNSFSAEYIPTDKFNNKGNIKLTWSTFSETNNDYFTIEKSINENNFEKIATTAGAGNSNDALKYEYIDENISNGVYYYKLRQTDYDGKFTEFGPVSVKCDKESNISIYPNPASDHIIINYFSENKTTANIQIVDAVGKIILDKKINLDKGANASALDISDFSKGIYFLQISQDDGLKFTRTKLLKNK